MVIFHSYVSLPEGILLPGAKNGAEIIKTPHETALVYYWPWMKIVKQNLLAGGAITILKNMSSSMGRIILYIMENSSHV